MDAAVSRGGRRSVGIGAEDRGVMDGVGALAVGALGFWKQPIHSFGFSEACDTRVCACMSTPEASVIVLKYTHCAESQ